MAERTGPKSLREQRREQQRELDALNEAIDKLRVQFERYFMGLERLAPIREREALLRSFRRTKLRECRNTAMRFKFQNLNARLVTYQQYWTRIMRLIEEGKFRRDRRKSPSGAPPTPAPAAKGPSEMENLYEAWSSARAEVGLKEVAYDKFAAKMTATRTKHRKQLGADDVKYSVKVKDGKVALTAKPVRK